MKWLLVVAVVVLAFPAGAAAKRVETLVLGRPSGRSVASQLSPELWALWGRLEPRPAPAGGYMLVYPLMERGIPARPGRWYPAAGVLCSGWRSGIEAGCGPVPLELASRLAGERVIGLFRVEPTTITRLTRRGVAQAVPGNVSVAVQRAFNQFASARPARAPSDCVMFRAAWRGPLASGRPDGFCVAPAGGVYAGGRAYPLSRGVALLALG